jgi:ribonuclease HII
LATIKEIKEQLGTVNELTDPYLVTLQSDERAGVQALVKRKIKSIEKEIAKQAAFQARFTLERDLWADGKNLVAGIDEVGRGCLAGPVVTAAVVLDEHFSLVDVNDSKQLTAEIREKLYPQILEQAVSVGIGVFSNDQIDQLGILNATKAAMVNAINDLDVTPQHLLIDAVQVPIDIPKSVMFKGDAKSISIAAASIVAKVYRDHLMRDYSEMYPGYGFEQNVGYGTKQHLDGLRELGVTPIHRRTFEPVPNFL